MKIFKQPFEFLVKIFKASEEWTLEELLILGKMTEEPIFWRHVEQMRKKEIQEFLKDVPRDQVLAEYEKLVVKFQNDLDVIISKAKKNGALIESTMSGGEKPRVFFYFVEDVNDEGVATGLCKQNKDFIKKIFPPKEKKKRLA